MSRCDRCPRAGLACAGELNHRLCQLVDPEHPDHHPEYLAALDRIPDDPPPPAYPSWSEQALNLAGSFARYVASWFANVDRAEYDRRRAVCVACPSGMYDAERDRCRDCGCNLSAKPWIAADACRLGHWSTGDPTPERSTL